MITDIWIIFKVTVEITILWFTFYRMLVFFEGTRAFQVLKGIVYLLVAFLASELFGFQTLNWLLTKLFGISVIAFLIIFQQEIRQGLARLGQQHLFNITLEESEIITIIDEISSAAFKLAQKKIGCLIAIERENKLQTYIESGIFIDSEITSELIQGIFAPNSPLHDGGMIIRGKKIIASSCLFPLSDNLKISKTMGTRHRAALGISEQTDAIILVVSEETKDISLVLDGRLVSIANQGTLTDTLKNLLITQNKKKK